jgi:hypothetical protein
MLFLVLAISIQPVELHAEIYRWLDENGRVHFSENAPAQQSSQEITGKLGEIGNFLEFDDVLDVDWYKPPGEYKPANVEVKIDLVDYQLEAAEYGKIRDGVTGIYESYSRWFGWSQAPNRPVVIKIFGNFDEFEQYQQQENNGHSTTRSHYSFYRKEVVMLGTEFKGATMGVLFHESSHAVLDMALNNAPNWINEGLAQCFEGIEAGGKKNLLPQSPARIEKIRHKLREGSLLPIEQYLGISDVQWRGSSARVENTYYLVAWSIMNSLLSSRQGIDTLRLVLSDMRSQGRFGGGSLVEMFNRAYPGGIRKLDRDWRTWIESRE